MFTQNSTADLDGKWVYVEIEECATKLFCILVKVSDVGSFTFYASLQGWSRYPVF